MELLVERTWKQNDYTIGKFYIDGVFFSNTMEDKDRGITDAMTPEEIKKVKVYGETAIPQGRYEVQLTYSNKFAPRAYGKRYAGKMPQIMNVKGFEGIRIHPLNTAKDSLGCIGLGKNSAKGMITEATAHYYKFMDEHFIPAIKKGEKIYITIK